MKIPKLDVIIIGGGASGLMAGIMAAENGAGVLILEHMDRIGKKILSTGNGKCNFTNLDQGVKNYRGEHPEFVKKIMEKFGLKETLCFFRRLGIYEKSRNGYLYPNSEQASAILEVLRQEAEHQKVKIECDVKVADIAKVKKEFCISTNKGNYSCKKVILATGSKAAPVTGSDGSGYELSKKSGHKIISPVPALVQLKGKGTYFKSLAGIRTEAGLTLKIDGTIVYKEQGELQLTDYGISGIPVFQLSRFATRGLEKRKKTTIVIDFIPTLNRNNLSELLEERIKNCPYKTADGFLIGLFHKKLGTVLLKESGIPLGKIVISLSKEEKKKLVLTIKEFTVEITGSKPFENAQTCAGGIDTKELDERTLESKIMSGLYFAGELIDIDGACGGYNLQWAWSSGAIAGISAAKSIQDQNMRNLI